jgi:hypothetical protein
MMIAKDITIGELVEILPDSVQYLSRAGIRCIRCGEPIWGTLAEAAKDNGFSDEDNNRFVADLNDLIEKGTEQPGA